MDLADPKSRLPQNNGANCQRQDNLAAQERIPNGINFNSQIDGHQAE